MLPVAIALSLALAPAAADAPAASASVAPAAPRGAYVEARNATVFAGACHYGAESTTQGREAVLALALEGGTEAGVPLAGVEIVCVVAADRNLERPEAERSSVVTVERGLAPEVRAAAVAWLVREHAGAFGRVREVREGDVRVRAAGEGFEVRAPGVELRGSLLPDRACCTMPFQVWYEPLLPARAPVVGRTDAFRCEAPALGRAWSRPGENCAFVGAFGPAR